MEDFESHIQKTYTYNFPIEEVFKAFTDKDIEYDKDNYLHPKIITIEK